MENFLYTCIVPTRSEKQLNLFLKHFLANNLYCGEILVFWNGTREDYQRIRYSEYGQMVEIIPALGMDVYEMYNIGMRLARSQRCLLINDDMIVCPAFDVQVPNHIQSAETIITWTVIEPGYVGVNHACIEANFGMDVESFEYDAFVKWNSNNLKKGAVWQKGLGWYMPVMFDRALAEAIGYYPTHDPFPAPNDIVFFEALAKEVPGYIKLPEAVYHFQRLSQRG